MKALRTAFLLSFFLFSAFLSAQEAESNGYLFPEYIQGTVLFDNGSAASAKLNYNCMDQRMFFMESDSVVLAFAEPAKILLVTIAERRFINGKNGAFFEQVPAGDGFFYIRWSSRIVSTKKASAYGSYSSTTAITNLGGFVSGGRYIDLKSNEKISSRITANFFLKIKNSYKSIDSVKALTKLYKGYESDIERFVTEQHIDFNQASDIARVVEYCNTLTK